MLFKICQEVLNKYPQTEIGYLIAEIDVKKTDDYTQMLKDCLSNVLIENNLNSQNYALNPQISGWRSVFKDFGISNKSSQKSSVEALLKRIVSGSKMWSVSNAVDVYNCFSVLSLIPMGAYDLEKIKGDIVVRYGKKGELFEPLGSSDNVTVDDKHVIYSDDEKVLCWLWNYRDSKHSSLGDTTKKAIYLLDTAFTMNHMTMKEAVQSFGECLTKIGSKVMSTGILSKENPQTELNLENLCEVSIEKSGLIEDLIEKKRKMYPAEATKVDVVLHDSKAKTNVKKKSVENGNLPDNNAVKPISMTIQYAATGNLSRLQNLIESDPTLAQSKDWFGNNLLIHAIVGNHTDTVKWLIESNFSIDPHSKNKNGEDAFDFALKQNNQEVLKLLK
jgi:lysyl-tRNA synthetase class 2